MLRAVAESRSVNPLDPAGLLRSFGILGVCAILFAETGQLIGSFLPGDSRPPAVDVLRGRRRARTARSERTAPSYPAPAPRKDRP